MDKQEILNKIKDKAREYAKDHAAKTAKNFYIVGKRDAATTILMMIRNDGLDAIIDVAHELLKHDPEQDHAKWILENQDKWNPKISSLT